MEDYEDNNYMDEYGIEEFRPEFNVEPYDVKWTIGTLTDEFPNAPYFLEDDILPTDVEYPKRYWKERKVLMGDIDFLLRLSKNHFHIVVYAGCSNGRHIKILSDMFQNIEFHLYDIGQFDNLVVNHPRIKLNHYYENNITQDRGNFTEKVAEYYKSISSNNIIVFISNINSDTITEQTTNLNQRQQENWIKIMNPVMSMLRFRVPYLNKEIYSYLDGEIRFNCWDRQYTDETRLIVFPPFKSKNINYTSYREQLSWYNLLLRNHDMSNEYLENFDIPLRMTVKQFWKRYLQEDINITLGFDFVFELIIITMYLRLFGNTNYEDYTRLIDYINSILMRENTSFINHFLDEEKVDITKFTSITNLEDLGGGEIEEPFPEEQKQDFAVPFRELERLGAPRAFGIEEDLSTMEIDGYRRIDQMSRTNEQIYKILATKAKERLNLNNNILNDTLLIMNKINKKDRGLRYKNPVAIMLALLCINNNKIDKQKLNKIYEQYGKQENMTEADILRYCFFVVDIM